MIEKSRVNEAVDKKRSGAYNCAQAVACTYADLTPLSAEAIARTTAAFGTGMGCMEATCGALIGAGTIIGLTTPDRMAARAKMKKIITAFAAKTGGATICKHLKGLTNNQPSTGPAKTAPTPILPCNDCVALSATLLEQELTR